METRNNKPPFSEVPETIDLFLKNLIADGAIDKGDRKGYLHFLVGDGSTLQTTTGLVEELKKFRKPPENASDPRIKSGLRVIKEFFRPKHKLLEQYNAVVYLYGSFIYGDAHNADYDLLICTDQEHPELYKLRNAWDSELEERWINPSGGHISYLSLDWVQKQCERVQAGDLDLVDKHTYELHSRLDEVSIILLNSLIYKPNEDAADKISQRAKQLIEQFQFLRGLVNKELDEALQIRIERQR